MADEKNQWFYQLSSKGMKEYILLFKVVIFLGLALFLLFYGKVFFVMPGSWRFILIGGLFLLAALRLFEWWTLRKEEDQ